jgi:hypothetical protein
MPAHPVCHTTRYIRVLLYPRCARFFRGTYTQEDPPSHVLQLLRHGDRSTLFRDQRRLNCPIRMEVQSVVVVVLWVFVLWMALLALVEGGQVPVAR